LVRYGGIYFMVIICMYTRYEANIQITTMIVVVVVQSFLCEEKDKQNYYSFFLHSCTFYTIPTVYL
jgi:hypothetical protein